jgi:uncharacterized phage protein (TIGR02218 family)
MSKTIPIALQAEYDSGSTRLAYGFKITRTDSEVFAFTSADKDTTISSINYASAPGLEVRSFVTSAGFAVDNTEITVLPDANIITTPEIMTGRWNSAQWILFRYNVADPTDGIETLGSGILGEFQLRNGAYVAELRGWQQYLQQPIGSVSTKTCRARLGDSLCTVNLASYTVTGTLTGVTSNQLFTDSSRAEAADYFGEGIITWTGGLNDGLSAKVKTHATGGVLTLMTPAIYTVQVGDTYSLVAGCRKRLDEDCATKFANALNFQGEPHRPTVDDVTSTPVPNVA